MAPPPQGSPYYRDPNNPNPKEEGVRFFDEEDERLYYEYLEKFQQFKEEFGAEAEEYNQKFFAMRPDKRTQSLKTSPNEWSASSYGRETPLWPSGTMRPPAAQLARLIQEQGAGVAPATAIASMHQLADRFRKTY